MSIWYFMAACGVLIILAALWDAAIGPWLYERKSRKFYERMKRRNRYEN